MCVCAVQPVVSSSCRHRDFCAHCADVDPGALLEVRINRVMFFLSVRVIYNTTFQTAQQI